MPNAADASPLDFPYPADSEAAADALLSGAATDRSLDQVREILFGAEARRVDRERRTLEEKVSERLVRLEAELERRYQQLCTDLQRRFDENCALLETEAAARRSSMQAQHDEFLARLKDAETALVRGKAGREELAGLLADVAQSLRSATSA
jgi:exonuclease VII large subunit